MKLHQALPIGTGESGLSMCRTTAKIAVFRFRFHGSTLAALIGVPARILSWQIPVLSKLGPGIMLSRYCEDSRVLRYRNTAFALKKNQIE